MTDKKVPEYRDGEGDLTDAQRAAHAADAAKAEQDALREAGGAEVTKITDRRGQAKPAPEAREAAPEAPPETPRPGIDEMAETGFLVILNKRGGVNIVTDMNGLKIERTAGAHDILRCCYDAAQQVSEMRIIGEMTRMFHGMIHAPMSGAVDAIAGKVIGAMGGLRK